MKKIQEIAENGAFWGDLAKSIDENFAECKPVDVIKTTDEKEPTDSNVFSALCALATLLRKDKADSTNHLLTLLAGAVFGDNKAEITAEGVAKFLSMVINGGKASIDTEGVAKFLSAVFNDGKAKIDSDGAAKFLSVLLGTGIETENFSTGALGAGFCLKKDENGDTYLEVDRMLVRKLATFVELLIQRLRYVGGQITLTPASMQCAKVEDMGDYYRCYFQNTDGEKTVEQEFVVGDQARCQTFNIKEGVHENVSNTYYWRLVVGVGDNYIDLSKADCDAGSTVPSAGDDIVQLGNRTDATRQAAIVLAAYGNDAPYIKMYRGINNFVLDGKEFATFSRSEVNIIADSLRFSTGENVKVALSEAVADAADAKAKAEQAQEDADAANTELGMIASDNYITPSEKTALKQQQADIQAEKSEIIANATRYGVSYSAYNAAYTLANNALTKYTASNPQNIEVGADYANISAYYAARKTILDAIAAAAKKLVTDLDGDLQGYKSEVTQKFEAVDGRFTSVINETKTYTDNAVGNIQVGGRNYIRNSAFEKDTSNWVAINVSISVDSSTKRGNTNSLKVVQSTASDTSLINTRLYQISTKLSPASLSFWVRADRTVNIKVRIGGDQTYTKTVSANTEWQKVVLESAKPTSNAVVFGALGACTWWISEPMLVEATKVSDWSPAPEDLTTKIEQNLTKIEQNSKEIALKASQDTVDNISGRLSSAEATLTVQAGQIASKASQNSVDTLTGRVTTAESRIEQNAESISLKVSKEEFDALQVGGRNIARKTSSEWCEKLELTNKENQNLSGFSDKIYLDTLKVGDTIIISLDYKWEGFVYGLNWDIHLQGTGNVTGWNSGSFPGIYIKNLNVVSGGSGEAHVSYTATVTENHLKNQYWSVSIRHDYLSGYASVRNFKVEKGNKETAWSPAPEDYTNDLNGSLGGMNLIDNSSFQKDLKGWSTNGASGTFTAAVVNDSAAGKCLQLWFSTNYCGVFRALTEQGKAYARAGEMFTISFDLYKKASVPAKIAVGFEDDGVDADNTIDVSKVELNKWTRLSITQTLKTSRANIIIYGLGTGGATIYVKNLMVERGNIATPWMASENERLLDTGIDILNRKMIFTADNTLIQDNSGKQIAMFTTKDGKPLLAAENIDVDNLKVKYLQGATGTFKGVLEAASGSFNGELVVSLLRTRLYTIPGGKSSVEIRPDVDQCCNYYFHENHVSSGDKYPSTVNVLLPEADFYEGLEISFFRMVTNSTSPYTPIVSTFGYIYFLSPYENDPSVNFITKAESAVISANKRVVFKAMDGKWFNVEGNCLPKT